MKKILLLLGILALGVSKVEAYPLDVGVYRSTVIVAAGTDTIKFSSGTNFVLVDYTVISTGNVDTFLSFYDSNLSTFQFTVKYASYPLTAYQTVPLGIELTSGPYCYIPLIPGSTSVAKVRLRFYRKSTTSSGN